MLLANTGVLSKVSCQRWTSKSVLRFFGGGGMKRSAHSTHTELLWPSGELLGPSGELLGHSGASGELLGHSGAPGASGLTLTSKWIHFGTGVLSKVSCQPWTCKSVLSYYFVRIVHVVPQLYTQHTLCTRSAPTVHTVRTVSAELLMRYS